MARKNASDESKKQISTSANSIHKENSIKPIDPSPCTVECPLGTNVKAYVSLIAAGRFAEALEVVRKTNPFPGICGRVCPHPCEDACLRADIDQPLAIAALKRFVADYELRRGILPKYEQKKRRQDRVAVIGSGPAGLSCASDLAREGCHVTVFELLPVPGGMLAVGIPTYRLPEEILRVEIAAIEALGVEIKLNVRVGDQIKLDELVKGFDAVFVATGLQKPRMLGVPGESEVEHGLIDWIPLMRDVALNRAEKPGDKLVIVGGGNSAVDCAREMLRLGTKDVQIVYRRSRNEMPAYKEEVADALEEGVKINFLCTPVRLISDKGKLVGVECVRTRLAEKDKSGRRRAIPIPNSEFVISCDGIIPAIGQELEPSFLDSKETLDVSSDRLLVVDPETLATNCKGVFAGGDAISGPASVVEAIQAGHRAARSVLCFLDKLPLTFSTTEAQNLSKELTPEPRPPQKEPRVEGLRLSPVQRRESFDEVEQGLTEAQAIAEAQRCLRCGPCLECSECVGVCDGKQILIEPGNKKGTDERGILVRLPADIHREIAAHEGVSVQYRGKQYDAFTITAKVDQGLCRGCGVCEETCGYQAVRVMYRGNGIFTAQVNEDMCRGCGTCVAVCPTAAIDQNYFTTKKMDEQIQLNLTREGQNRSVIMFACWWHPGIRIESEEVPHVIIPVMCIGRIGGGDILRVFQRGAEGVLLIGCGDDCHYRFGKQAARETLGRLSDILVLLGFERSRLRIVEVPSEGESEKIENALNDFLNEIEKLGKNPIGGAK